MGERGFAVRPVERLARENDDAALKVLNPVRLIRAGQSRQNEDGCRGEVARAIYHFRLFNSRVWQHDSP